jgi:nucleoside-diphosphate-sugar epimerase
MKVVITGGTGFVGRHLAEKLKPEDTVIISRRTGHDLNDEDSLAEAFKGCEVIVHCAGINREIGNQTYERVHVEATATVIHAARRAGVKKIVMLSFLRARPYPGKKYPFQDSPYHQSKWTAEELIRQSGLDYTILKAGMIYGKGDHLVDHLSHTVQTVPLFATVGIHEKTIRPIPVDEAVTILLAAIKGRLSRQTVAVVGAEELTLTTAVKRVADVWGRKINVIPAPVIFQYGLARLTELTMKVPLVARAQVKMLSEGVSEPDKIYDTLPDDLKPRLPFNEEQIRKALPEPGSFGFKDLRISKK